MIEGDFKHFEGKWSVEQVKNSYLIFLFPSNMPYDYIVFLCGIPVLVKLAIFLFVQNFCCRVKIKFIVFRFLQGMMILFCDMLF